MQRFVLLAGMVIGACGTSNAAVNLTDADYGPYPSNMTARNNFRRPGYWNLDGGLYKNINLTERYSIQLRGEFYNVFNHANLFLNDGAVDIFSSPFVTAYKEGRRQIQLAVKFIF